MKDGQYYGVIGYVDAENSFGTKLRNDFVVILKKNNNEFEVYDCAIE
ncbi:MAG: hypothetical protein ACLSVX_01890 [Massilimicrobiota timonensis]